MRVHSLLPIVREWISRRLVDVANGEVEHPERTYIEGIRAVAPGATVHLRRTGPEPARRYYLVEHVKRGGRALGIHPGESGAVAEGAPVAIPIPRDKSRHLLKNTIF